MAWYDSAVFYHIYPLGLCGCSKENTGVAESHFDKLRQWAEHAVEIGCNALYIGPLFESVGHGYETTDYKKVDIRLGTNEDFKEFVAHCHQMGMKVIVDGVFNHVGRRFFAFEDMQRNREQSPYRDWFCNVNFGGNNEYNDGFCYENWGGYNLLVKLNQRNPAVRDYLFDVIRFWVREFDIDGIRLDAADVLDFDFMKQMRHETDQMKEDFWLMGEVIHGDYSRWANDDTLHAVTNYELHKGLYSGHNDHNYFEIAHSIRRLNDLCGGRKLYTFVDNHDVERIYSKLNNKEHMKLVTILLYTVYGIPSVYYGSEFGIEGRKEHGSDWNLRPCLELADYADAVMTNPTTKLCAQLGRLKKDYRELTEGRYQELQLTNRQFAFGRLLAGSGMVTVLNCDDAAATVECNVSVEAVQGYDMLGLAEQVEYQNGRLRVTLPANTGTVVLLSNQPPVSTSTRLEGEAAGAGTVKESDCDAAVSVLPGGQVSENVQSESMEKMPQGSLRLDGFGIMVEDMKTMVAFYHDVLGFEIEYTEGMKNVYLKKDGTLFLMYGRRDFERMTSRGYEYVKGPNGHYEIALGVDTFEQVDQAYERAVALGAKSVLPPETEEWGQRTCYVADPEGNLIEIGSFGK